MNLKAELERRLVVALAKAAVPAGSPALVGRSARPELGDYQANGIMAAAKTIKANPRQLAEKVAAAADLSDIAEKLEIAGPGFINIRLKRDWLTGQLVRMADDEHLGVDQHSPDQQQIVVVDYSGPNLAKEMHVGHLRSTIIGDALARVLDFTGQNVIRQNHVGDWGTQFGMLILILQIVLDSGEKEEGELDELGDLEEIYRIAKQMCDSDPKMAKKARENVVRLQSGDQEMLARWRIYKKLSLSHCEKVYERLDVKLTIDDVRGESFYNDDLPIVVADLQKAGLLKESQGAQCVFLEEFKDKNGETLPLIVQKSDEGYLYATTDLAAIRYRVGVLHANRVLYVTDSRQALHFRQVFAVARKGGICAGGRVAGAHSLRHDDGA